MRKILHNLRTWLIHKLGGLTYEESQQSDYDSYRIGQYSVAVNLKSFAESIYGKPADEWCHLMYEYIKSTFQTIEKS